MEEWKNIKGYLGYQVSNLGNVRSYNKVTVRSDGVVRHWKNKVMKYKTNKKGYKRIALWKDGEYKTFSIHRLVAEAFIYKPKNKDVINHLDGNKKNNRVDNLEWTDYSGNLMHAYETGLNKECCPVVLYKRDENFIKRFRSYAEASRFLKYGDGFLSANLKRGVYVIDGYEVFTMPIGVKK